MGKKKQMDNINLTSLSQSSNALLDILNDSQRLSGRWNLVENFLYLKYSLKYCTQKSDRKIARKIKTRTLDQVRSHTQKIDSKILKSVKAEETKRQAQQQIRQNGNKMVTRHHRGCSSQGNKQQKNINFLWEKPDSYYKDLVRQKKQEMLQALLPRIIEAGHDNQSDESTSEIQQQQQKKQKIEQQEQNQEESLRIEPQNPNSVARNRFYQENLSFYAAFLEPILLNDPPLINSFTDFFDIQTDQSTVPDPSPPRRIAERAATNQIISPWRNYITQEPSRGLFG